MLKGADLFRWLQDRGLGVESIEQEDHPCGKGSAKPQAQNPGLRISVVLLQLQNRVASSFLASLAGWSASVTPGRYART